MKPFKQSIVMMETAEVKTQSTNRSEFVKVRYFHVNLSQLLSAFTR